MSVFTPGEIDYLQKQSMGRLATVGPDGQPHVVPVTYWFNEDEDAIDIGGIDFANTKKWRDARQNPKVTFLVDDFEPSSARAIEVRAEAEVHETGGSQINPRVPGFAEQFIRLRPRHVVTWGLDKPEGMTAEEARAGFKVSSRRVG